MYVGSDIMQLLTAHWSPYLLPHQSRHVMVTPRTECNIMRLFTIYKFGCMIKWRQKALNWAREETKTILKSLRPKNDITPPLRKNEDKVIFCHLFPLLFSHYCNVIWFSIIFLFGLVWAAENPSWSLQSCIRTHILEEKQHFRSNDKCIALHLGFDGIH